MGSTTFVVIAIFMVLGTWASQASSRTLHDEVKNMHEQWAQKYGRTYANDAEKGKRFKIFRDNVGFVEKFNSEGNRTYKLGIDNEFADLTSEEFLTYYTGFNKPTHSPKSSAGTESFRYANLTDVSDNVDWRKKGAVNAIKNQHQCGCCWAFSAVAAIESITQIKTGKLVSLSEQQLVDCDKNNHGCNGGIMDAAFEYIKENQGISSEEDYPYQAMDGGCDSQKASKKAAHISAYEDVTPNSEEDLRKAVSQQPVSVAVAVGNQFQFYKGGVFTGGCGERLNHAVTLIGYGYSDEDGKKYWLVRNSWGETWGESGYMKLQREAGQPEGLCGIASVASFPTI